MNKFPMAYWIVIYTDIKDLNKLEEVSSHQIRVSWNKSNDPKSGCIDCWGMASSNMWVKPFTRINDWRNKNTRKILLKPEGFIHMKSIIGKYKVIS